MSAEHDLMISRHQTFHFSNNYKKPMTQNVTWVDENTPREIPEIPEVEGEQIEDEKYEKQISTEIAPLSISAAKFEVTIQELRDIAKEAKEIVIDYKDPKSVKKADELRKKIKNLRVSIKNQWEAAREKTNLWNKWVLKVQNFLIGLIEPDEENLEKKIKDAEELKKKQEEERNKKRYEDIKPFNATSEDLANIPKLTDQEFSDLLKKRKDEFDDKQKELASIAEEVKKCKAKTTLEDLNFFEDYIEDIYWGKAPTEITIAIVNRKTEIEKEIKDKAAADENKKLQRENEITKGILNAKTIEELENVWKTLSNDEKQTFWEVLNTRAIQLTQSVIVDDMIKSIIPPDIQREVITSRPRPAWVFYSRSMEVWVTDKEMKKIEAAEPVLPTVHDDTSDKNPGEVSYYDTLWKIVDQLKLWVFIDANGNPLENHVAFIALEEKASEEHLINIANTPF